MITTRLVVDRDEALRVVRLANHRFVKMPDRFAKRVIVPIFSSMRKKALAQIWDKRTTTRHWAPLSRATLLEKKRLGMYPRSILMRTAALKRSLLIKSDPQHYERTFHLGPGRWLFVIASLDPKFNIHHEGVPSKNLPQRPLLPNVPLLEAWATMSAERQILVPKLEEDLRRPMSAR